MKKILVIEDESSLRKGIYDVLKFEDFEVLEAENGKIGIQKAFEIASLGLRAPSSY